MKNLCAKQVDGNSYTETSFGRILNTYCSLKNSSDIPSVVPGTHCKSVNADYYLISWKPNDTVFIGEIPVIGSKRLSISCVVYYRLMRHFQRQWCIFVGHRWFRLAVISHFKCGTRRIFRIRIDFCIFQPNIFGSFMGMKMCVIFSIVFWSAFDFWMSTSTRFVLPYI